MITCNVRGLSDPVKRRELFIYLRSRKANIAFLQETHSCKKSYKRWRAEWGGEILFSHGESNARGVAILIDRTVNFQKLAVKTDHDGRFIILKAKIGDETYTLVNVYGPNKDEPAFYSNLFEEALLLHDSDHIIVGGDFNTVLDPEMDRKGGRPGKSKSRTAEFLQGVMEEYDWLDPWRYLNPDKFQYTWKRRKPFVGTRLDFFLLPMSSLGLVDDCEIILGYKSDHSFVQLDFANSTLRKGKGFWKLNCAYLENKEYIDKVNEIITKSLAGEIVVGEDQEDKFSYLFETDISVLSPGLRWEMLKTRIVDFSIAFSKQKAQQRQEKMQYLKSKLSRLEKKLAMINLKSLTVVNQINKVNQKIDVVKTELEKELAFIARGAMIRSKVKWFVEGEHNTKYFLSLEKSKAKSKQMNAIRKENGIVVRNLTEILNQQAQFYEKLYTVDTSVKFVQTTPPEKKLTSEQADTINGPLTIEEIGISIAKMPRNKTPGSDGLPADFYKVFFIKLKFLLCEVFNEAKDCGRLHLSARRGIITLLPKKDWDILLVKNWRPITLLNCDYKIISKVISHRIQAVLENVINQDQARFVQNRNITQNIRRASDILDYVSKRNIAAVMVSIDFEKAFDRVEYSSLFSAFTYFNFGEQILSWMQMLFQDVQLCTVNAGSISHWFSPTRGLFQGNPIGPFAFVTLIEILAINLRSNSKIEGIKIGHITHLISQFADDLDLFLKFKQSCWEETLSVLRKFEEISGMKVNYDKTSVYRIGSIKGSNAKFYSMAKIKWTNNPVNILGVYVANDWEQTLSLNYDPLVVKCQSVVDMWHHRAISLFGKVLVLNSLVASQLAYRMSVLCNIPVKYVKTFKEMFTKFVWNTRTPKIRWNILILPKGEGGAGLVNLQLRDHAMKLAWIAKVFTNPIIENLSTTLLNNPLGTLIWELNIAPVDFIYLNVPDSFWADVLFLWCKYDYNESQQVPHPGNQIIWFNSSVRISDKPIFYQNWFNQGVIRLKDMQHETGRMLTFQEFSRKYNILTNFLEYQGVVAAIPKTWRNKMQQIENSDITLLQTIKLASKPTSKIYQQINTNKLGLEHVWSKQKVVLTFDELLNAVKEVNALTIAVKLRSFQFRMLHAAVITNVQLKHFKIKDTNLCTFCNFTKETTEHLFHTCEYVSQIWEWFTNHVNKPITFKDVLLSSMGVKILNTLSLLAKHYIYTSRCNGEKPNLERCFNYFKRYQLIEQEVAKNKGKIAAHEEKWRFINEYIE